MEFDLLCHAHTPMPAIEAVRVRVEIQPQRSILLHYTVIGDMRQIAMPIMMAQERADDLWRTTCFEAFLTREEAGPYLELNFSPSSQWAAYAFPSYRSGRQNRDTLVMPRIDIKVSARSLELSALVDLTRLTFDPSVMSWRAGFSAVIETRDGAKSYWALAHPPGEPDFHHRDCFAAILRAPVPE
jgi:hypothetical protein